MKNKRYLAITTLLLLFASTQVTLAQDWAQWHLPEGAKARLGKGMIGQVRYSPDGTKLAAASSIGIQIYDTQTGDALDLLTAHATAFGCIAFSPVDGTILAAGSDGPVYLWDVETGKHLRTFEGHTLEVNSVSFSPDGATLASGSVDGTVLLWDVSQKE